MQKDSESAMGASFGTLRTGAIISRKGKEIMTSRQTLTTWIPKFRRLIPSGTRGGRNIGRPSLGSVVKRSVARNEDVTVNRFSSFALIAAGGDSVAGEADLHWEVDEGVEFESRAVTSGVWGTGDTEPEDGVSFAAVEAAAFGVDVRAATLAGVTVTMLVLLCAVYGGGGCEGTAVAGADGITKSDDVKGGRDDTDGMQSSMLMSVIGLVHGVVRPAKSASVSVSVGDEMSESSTLNSPSLSCLKCESTMLEAVVEYDALATKPSSPPDAREPNPKLVSFWNPKCECVESLAEVDAEAELETVSAVETDDVDSRRTPSWSYSNTSAFSSTPSGEEGEASDAGDDEDVGKLMVEW